MKNIRVITASAGTGKTTRLAKLLEGAIGEGSVRPEAIVATTFTNQAAAELRNRARTNLLKSGHGREAQALLTARIGTVNAVCGSLVSDFSFELGLSPQLRVLDEDGGELELKRALASVVGHEESEYLDTFKDRFDLKFDWQYEIRRIIEAGRANGIGFGDLAACAERSVTSLEECLQPAAEDAEAIDRELAGAIKTALGQIAANSADNTLGTRRYCDLLRQCARDHERDRLRWGDWAKLGKEAPTKKSAAQAIPVQTAANRHIEHPRLRAEMNALIRLMFDVAARGLDAYQERKRDRGLMDFVDQEVKAWELLSDPDVCAALQGQIDMVLIDEFQDTSPLQLAIFLKLAEIAPRSVWVGDPKQAIYGFRGTDPALMDAAIESLSSPSRDPELVAAAIEAVSTPVEILTRSYRSRPSLVSITNDIFEKAFAQQQGMAADRVRSDAERDEDAAMGPAIGHWPLEGRNVHQRVKAAAAGVQTLMASKPRVWDRDLNTTRVATPSDVGILCRTNALCNELADELGVLGFSAVVARSGLLDTMEAQVVLAGMRLWVDGRDNLAAATLLRILEHPQDPDGFVSSVTSATAKETLSLHPAVQAIRTAREELPDVDVPGAVDAVIDALDVRGLCAQWGNDGQRLANLDALRAHAIGYCNERASGHSASSLVGFLAYLDDLTSTDMWRRRRRSTSRRHHYRRRRRTTPRCLETLL